MRPASDAHFDAAYTDQAQTVREACRGGEAASCAVLANMYADGTGTLEDGPLAFSINYVACQDGSDDACLAVSDNQSFETDEGIVGPHVAHFEARCAEGWAKACEKLALYTLYGFHVGVAKDQARSQDLSAQACAFGAAKSCMTIGETERALALFQAACDAGDMDGCVQVGRSLRSTDPSAAHAMLQAACDAAPDQHCRSYGAMLSEDDPDKSLMPYRQGCDAGDLYSCQSVVKRIAEVGGDLTEARAAYAQACASQATNSSFCRETLQTGLSGLELWDPDVAGVIGQTEDVSEISASCAAGESAGCLALAQAHAQLGSSKAAYVNRGLNERACTLGAETACTSAIAQLSSRTVELGETLCAAGMDAACVQLIWINRDVDGAERLEDLRARCDDGSAAACGYVGSVLVNGGDRLNTSVALDLEQGERLLQRGCDSANAQACVELGRLKDPDIRWNAWEGVAKDEPLAMTLYEKACDQGLAYGCSMRTYASDRTGDIETAMIYAVKSCALGGCRDVSRLQLYLERRALDAEHSSHLPKLCWWWAGGSCA